MNSGVSDLLTFEVWADMAKALPTPSPKAKALPKALFVGTLSETTSRDEER